MLQHRLEPGELQGSRRTPTPGLEPGTPRFSVACSDTERMQKPGAARAMPLVARTVAPVRPSKTHPKSQTRHACRQYEAVLESVAPSEARQTRISWSTCRQAYPAEHRRPLQAGDEAWRTLDADRRPGH